MVYLFMFRFSVLNMEPDCGGNILEHVFVGSALAVTSLKVRAHGKVTVAIAFNDNRKPVDLLYFFHTCSISYHGLHRSKTHGFPLFLAFTLLSVIHNYGVVDVAVVVAPVPKLLSVETVSVGVLEAVVSITVVVLVAKVSVMIGVLVAMTVEVL